MEAGPPGRSTHPTPPEPPVEARLPSSSSFDGVPPSGQRAAWLVPVLVSFMLVHQRSTSAASFAPPQFRTGTNPRERRRGDLESMLGATSHQFEPRIRRIANLGTRKPRLLSSRGFRDLPSQLVAGMRRWTRPPPRRPKPPKATGSPHSARCQNSATKHRDPARSRMLPRRKSASTAFSPSNSPSLPVRQASPRLAWSATTRIRPPTSAPSFRPGNVVRVKASRGGQLWQIAQAVTGQPTTEL